MAWTILTRPQGIRYYQNIERKAPQPFHRSLLGGGQTVAIGSMYVLLDYFMTVSTQLAPIRVNRLMLLEPKGTGCIHTKGRLDTKHAQQTHKQQTRSNESHHPRAQHTQETLERQPRREATALATHDSTKVQTTTETVSRAD